MTLKGDADLYGVLGHPIAHSLSPVFQNVAFAYLGLNAVYIPIDVQPQAFEITFNSFKNIENLRGLNITVPFKEKVLELSDQVSEEAKLIGAVNTVSFVEGRAIGYNTDWIGFLKAIEEVTHVEGKRVLVLGAGGASRAVVYALKRAGAEVFLWNRTLEKALRLSQAFGVKVVERVEETLSDVQIIVNTTSVGLNESDPLIFDYELISPQHVVVDIIYRETALIKKAKERGSTHQTGFPMLLYQGAESFRIWTGCEPPIRVMKKALEPFGYPKNG